MKVILKNLRRTSTNTSTNWLSDP